MRQDTPSAKVPLSNSLSFAFTVWGQYIVHDIVQTPDTVDVECDCNDNPPDYSINCEQVSLKDDPILTQMECIHIVRSQSQIEPTNPSLDANSNSNPLIREQLNQLTSFIDATTVYGASSKLLNLLRDADKKKLRVKQNVPHGNLLPDVGQFTDQSIQARFAHDLAHEVDKSKDPTIDAKNNLEFVAGDTRVGDNPVLSSYHTLFVRLHNYIVDELERENPLWEPERLFEEARVIVIAIHQRINYGEHLPILLGKVGYDILDNADQEPNLSNLAFQPPKQNDPSVRNEFAVAGYRWGHPTMLDQLDALDSDNNDKGDITIADNFFDPAKVLEYGPGSCLRGAMNTFTGEVSNMFRNTLQNDLFRPKGHAHGSDLLSINIARARDHGVGSYEAVLEFCMNHPDYKGLYNGKEPEYRSGWNNLFINTAGQENKYKALSDVDLYVGLVFEKPSDGSPLGPTFSCINVDQFIALKKGDDYFYTNPGYLNNEQLEEIEEVTLARVLCTVLLDDIVTTPPHAFYKEGVDTLNGDSNSAKTCAEIGKLKLDAWKNTNPPQPIIWSQWGEWSTCTSECGGGTQRRIRVCPIQRCEGESEQYKYCEKEACGDFNTDLVLSESWATGRFLRCIVWGDPHVIQFDGSFVDILAKRQTYKLIEYRTVTEEQLKVEYSISVTTNSRSPSQCQELTITIGSDDLVFNARNGEITIGGQRLTKGTGNLGGVSFSWDQSDSIPVRITFDSLKLSVRLWRVGRFEIFVPKENEGDFIGYCGNEDNSKDNNIFEPLNEFENFYGSVDAVSSPLCTGPGRTWNDVWRIDNLDGITGTQNLFSGTYRFNYCKGSPRRNFRKRRSAEDDENDIFCSGSQNPLEDCKSIIDTFGDCRDYLSEEDVASFISNCAVDMCQDDSQELKEEAARTLVDLCSTYSVNAGDSVDIPCDFVQTANCPEFSYFDGCAKSCDLRSCSDYLAKKTCEDNGYLLGGCVCDNGLIMENGNCIPLSDCQLTGLTKWSEWTECSDDCLSPISTGNQRRQRIDRATTEAEIEERSCVSECSQPKSDTVPLRAGSCDADHWWSAWSRADLSSNCVSGVAAKVARQVTVLNETVTETSDTTRHKVSLSLSSKFECNDADQIRGFTCESETQYFEHSFCCQESACGPGYRWNAESEECVPKVVCPEGACWSFDQASMSCKVSPSCNEVTCGATRMLIHAKKEVFGGQDLSTAAWTTDLPAQINTGGNLEIDMELGAPGMIHHLTKDKIHFKVFVAIEGENRARSNIAASQINLGDMDVYTTPFGVGVEYECVYDRAVTVSNDMTVQTVTAFGEKNNLGNLAQSFSLQTNGHANSGRFIMGSQIETSITWSLQNLANISFVIERCAVKHGDISIDVIKDGCFATLLNARPENEESHRKSFSFQTFKGTDETSSTQEIECNVRICGQDECKNLKEKVECEIGSTFKYSVDGNSIDSS